MPNPQPSPSHLRALQRYNRVLLQRNQVLRLVRERRQPASALEPWTPQRCDWGSLVLRQRLCMLSQVDERIVSIFRDLAGTTETLRVVYRSTACAALTDPPPEPTDLAAEFKARQERVATREIDQAV